MCIQIGSWLLRAHPAASCANPERPLTYSGPVLPQSFDLTDTVLLGRLLALPHLTLPQYAVLFTFIPCKEAPQCIMEERDICLAACLPVIYGAGASELEILAPHSLLILQYVLL